jgi:Leucine-rich repeat (LRR) protein
MKHIFFMFLPLAILVVLNCSKEQSTKPDEEDLITLAECYESREQNIEIEFEEEVACDYLFFEEFLDSSDFDLSELRLLERENYVENKYYSSLGGSFVWYLTIANARYVSPKVKNLIHLGKLRIKHNSELDTLPREIWELDSLIYIEIENNPRLTKLPALTHSLAHVQTIDIYNMPNLTELPNLMYFPSLIYLDARIMDSIKTFPLGTERLANLTRIDLGGTQISEIPERVTQVANLREFRVGSDRLTKLTADMSDMVNLKRLYLTSDSIKEFPMQILDIPNLDYVSLSGDLTELPLEKYVKKKSNGHLLTIGCVISVKI